MKRVEHLIKQVRRQTDNLQVGTDQGMSDEEIIRFLNDAQDDIFGAIVNTFKQKFLTTHTFSAVANQSSYSLPPKAYMGAQTAMLEWSITGLERDYRALKRVTMREKVSCEGWPARYSVSDYLYVWPIPIAAQGMFKATYTKKIPMLDKRRAKINTVTIAGGQITAMTLLGPTGAAFTSTDADGFTENDYLCVVSSTGTVKAAGIAYTAVSNVGVVTLDGNYTLQTGETAAAGDYIVLGQYATTHSELTDDCERYLLAYTAWKVYKRDSNDDFGPQQQELGAMREQILDNYAELNLDIEYTPQVNDFYDWG